MYRPRAMPSRMASMGTFLTGLPSLTNVIKIAASRARTP